MWSAAWVWYVLHQNFMTPFPPPQPRYFARVCAAAFLWCQVLSEDRTKERPRYTHTISGFSCKYRYLIINYKFLGKFYQLGIFKLKCVSLTNNFISRWVLANVWFYQRVENWRWFGHSRDSGLVLIKSNICYYSPQRCSTTESVTFQLCAVENNLFNLISKPPRLCPPLIELLSVQSLFACQALHALMPKAVK